ncbi:MAG TPA: MAPEG family protein [Caulobacteraceae bacterium]|nr:MAPEG family protein [Caulobacteraceae bacterium]
MQIHPLVAIVSLLALLLYFYMSLRVGQGRSKYGVAAPAVTGHPDFERDYRIQMNTLEWLPIFLVSLWLFAISWGSDLVAAGIGVVWLIGRVLYLTGYSRAAEARGPGFGIQALAAGVLLFGALGRIVWLMVQHGA